MSMHEQIAGSREAMASAHQYLYYVLARPVISDYQYDRFCEANGIQCGGGSDMASSYPPKIIELAEAMLAGTHPRY